MARAAVALWCSLGALVSAGFLPAEYASSEDDSTSPPTRVAEVPATGKPDDLEELQLHLAVHDSLQPALVPTGADAIAASGAGVYPNASAGPSGIVLHSSAGSSAIVLHSSAAAANASAAHGHAAHGHAAPRAAPNDWQEVARDEPEGSSLRQAARAWHSRRAFSAQPFVATTKHGRPGVIAHCNQCSACTTAWRHTWSTQGRALLVVERSGECSGPANVARISLENAKKYVHLPPARALAVMAEIGENGQPRVPATERPTLQQLSDQRRPRQDRRPCGHYPAVCLGSLQLFLDNPPAGVHVYKDHCVVEPDRIRIPFTSTHTAGWEPAAPMEAFLMDFTFNTNRHGLLLGCIGPVGLRGAAHALPTMRFVPTLFVIADKEDEEAHRLCVRLFFELAGPSHAYTDAFLDYACLQGARAELGAAVRWHRCLQHTKVDVKLAAKTVDEGSGRTRLSRMELLPFIIECVEFSAYLPPGEFHVFWSSVLGRMGSSTLETDWGEPAMADYLRTHILLTTGPEICAEWSSAFGHTLLGLTTYAPNCIERTHRACKHLLHRGYRKRDLADLIVELCGGLDSRHDQGLYTGLAAGLTQPPACLFKWPRRGRAQAPRARGAAADAEALAAQGVRLDVRALLQHYLQCGPAATYLRRKRGYGGAIGALIAHRPRPPISHPPCPPAPDE